MHRGLVLCQIDDDGIHLTLTLVIKSHASQLQLKMPNIIWSLCKTHTTHSRSLPNVTTRIIFAILNNLRLQPHQLSCSADAPPGFSDELPLVSLWSPWQQMSHTPGRRLTSCEGTSQGMADFNVEKTVKPKLMIHRWEHPTHVWNSLEACSAGERVAGYTLQSHRFLSVWSLDNYSTATSMTSYNQQHCVCVWLSVFITPMSLSLSFE